MRKLRALIASLRASDTRLSDSGFRAGSPEREVSAGRVADGFAGACDVEHGALTSASVCRRRPVRRYSTFHVVQPVCAKLDRERACVGAREGRSPRSRRERRSRCAPRLVARPRPGPGGRRTRPSRSPGARLLAQDCEKRRRGRRRDPPEESMRPRSRDRHRRCPRLGRAYVGGLKGAGFDVVVAEPERRATPATLTCRSTSAIRRSRPRPWRRPLSSAGQASTILITTPATSRRSCSSRSRS